MNKEETAQKIKDMLYKNNYAVIRNDYVDLIVKFIEENYISKSEVKITENTSDGFHTFKELYEFRKIYNAVLFNEWSKQGKFNIHKSKRHSDGEECFGGGWFIVMATLPTGQISNHYELKDLDLFQCEERKFADKWDEHNSNDVLKRLKQYIKNVENIKK